jgi:hypothetical protein
MVCGTHQFFFLSFSNSCLVSSSLSEVWLVLSFRRSALWFMSACFCLAPFLWGRVRDLSAGSQLSACYVGLLIVFHFSLLFDFGCCSLAQEMSFVDCYLPYFRQWFITCPLPAFVYYKFMWRSAPCSFPLLRCALSTPALLLCVPFQFLVYYTVFF